MPFAGLLGIELVHAEPDEVRARLAWDESRCTAGGILHGGALIGLADAAGGLCAYLNLPDGAQATATIESKTNFFRAGLVGARRGRLPRAARGRTTIVVETDVRDADGKHVARVTQTQAVFRASASDSPLVSGPNNVECRKGALSG